MSRETTAVDVHVGGRLKLRRQLMGITQEQMADKLGLTFQQVQKYEKGSNRISAARLLEISHILNVPFSFFFDGAPEAGVRAIGGVDTSDLAYNILTSPQIIRAARLMNRMTREQQGKIADFLALAIRLSGRDTGEELEMESASQ